MGTGSFRRGFLGRCEKSNDQYTRVGIVELGKHTDCSTSAARSNWSSPFADMTVKHSWYGTNRVGVGGDKQVVRDGGKK